MLIIFFIQLYSNDFQFFIMLSFSHLPKYLKVIDFIVSKFPNIKLIFWCLYKRTKSNKNSSYPKHLWYDSIKERYKHNILDIDLFTTPEDFNSKILDEGGHPNKKGFILLDSMINGYSK